MTAWLRRFLYSGDPIVKVAAGFSEPEALMYKELLENNRIPAMVKNTRFESVAYGWSIGNECDLFVRRSDLARARELLGPLVRDSQLVRDE